MKEYITTVTQKGQVTIPKILRDAVGIETYKKVSVKSKGKYIFIYPNKDILDIAGKIKTQNKKPALLAREYLEKGYERN
ncbi:MAG: AbrB/MazE/SpoVT family DNA-binding domain-containing protein [Patescibacteria group bacterium]|nr:AbrB/MazE/SpoVT family DNA-binding domain-containing protein [Patescibacteria group bacterium]